MSGTEGDDGNRHQGRDNHHQRRENKGEFARLGRNDVFLEKELETIGDRLEQSEPPGHGRSETGLHVSDQFTLEPGSVSNHQHHHAEDSQNLYQHDCNEHSGCI